MTLDEAIEHALEQSRSEKCKACADEHRQLAEWLQDLKEKDSFISSCRYAGVGGLELLREDAIKLYKNY
ncbi:MAG: hypothetical protein RR838_06475 [Clostridium sp.]